jgi:hydrocephalus-inducing protein
MENNPLYKKGVFLLENESITIPKNDVPQEIRVWAIPDEDKLFKDEIIVMIKDNPLPVQIPLQCQGCVPDVQIVEGQTVVFHRLLINQSGKK